MPMLPTVADILALPAVRRGRPRVIVGASGLSRQVRWVHAAEVSDIGRLLRGSELVLTTGIALPSDDSALRGYVAGLARAGAAGLIVELGRRWTQRLPAAIVEGCEGGELPLVALRREVEFAAIAQAAGELVVDSQLLELRAAERVHETFTALSVTDAEPADVLAEVSRISGLPVVLESAQHRVLAYNSADEDPTEVLTDWERRSAAVTANQRTAYDDESGWLVTVVGARGDDWGRLVMLSPDTPAHHHVVLVERAASTLAIQRLASRDRDNLERQTHRTLLTALASTGPIEPTLISRCAAAGVPVHGRRLVGVVVAPHPSSHSAPAMSSQQILRELTEAMATTARAIGIPALVAVIDDRFSQALVSLPHADDHDAVVDRLAAEIHRAAEKLAQPMMLVIGCGTAVDKPSDAHRSLAEARHVATAAQRAPHRRVCYRLANVHLRGLLALLSDDQRLDTFVDRELGRLCAYDDTHGTSLMEVLLALFRHGGNKVSAASSLHLSRTVFYERLGRVERVLDVDLTDPEIVTSLHVAVLAREVLHRHQVTR